MNRKDSLTGLPLIATGQPVRPGRWDAGATDAIASTIAPLRVRARASALPGKFLIVRKSPVLKRPTRRPAGMRLALAAHVQKEPLWNSRW